MFKFDFNPYNKDADVPAEEVAALAKIFLGEKEEEAPSMGVSKKEFDKIVSMYQDSLPGGRADKRDPSKFDETQLRMGISIEREHTNDDGLALEIAMDHLAECPDYYSRLVDMEKSCLGVSKTEMISFGR